MSIVDGNWKTFMARTLVLGGVVFGAVKLAVADPGGPSSPDALTFAGVLRERMGTTGNTLTFLFRRSGGTTSICTATTGPFAVDSGGAFSVQVPLGGCPNSRTLFDGDTVVYDVRLGSVTGDLIASDVAVTAVPYARFADQAGVNNDCPAGFGLDRGASPGTVCVRSLRLGSAEVRDEVVKVGISATAFWVDRYEAAILLRADGTHLGAARTTGGGADDIASASGLQRSGQYPRGPFPVVAASRVGLPTVNVTWFQANQACRFSGKRLMTGSEWLAAAVGTPDGSCNVAGSVQAPVPTAACVSSAGAFGMIGNVAEWTDEWYSGAGAITTPTTSVSLPDAGVTPILRPVGTDGDSVDGLRVNLNRRPWPGDYGDSQDRTDNVTAATIRIFGEPASTGIPAAAQRGGAVGSGDGAGVFAFDINAAPTFRQPLVGFRCMIPR